MMPVSVRRLRVLRLTVIAAIALLSAACARPAAGPTPAAPTASDPRATAGPFDHLFAAPLGRFVHISSYDTTGGNLDRLEIAAGDSAVLLDHRGPGVIRRIWITVSSRDPDYLRRIALKMYWDGETDPSVLVPLGDFFGNGFDKRHYTALPAGTSSGGFYFYLPMPFNEQARIVAENGTGRTIDAFYYNIDLVELETLPREPATFHAWWHRDPRTTGLDPHLVLDARGRGQFLGLSLNAESHAGRLWFLEGDEIFTVDGEFRGQGTGTEDYFNGGWYFDRGEFAAPFHGVVVKDDTLARIAAYRWHVPDPIPFHESLRIELEHGHANQEVADYATVAYWYQVEPHAPLPPLPGPDERRILNVKIPPGAVPRDSLAAEARPGGLTVRVPVPRADLYEVLWYPVGGPGREPIAFQVTDGSAGTISLEAAAVNTVLEPVTLDTVAAAAVIIIEALGPGDLRPAAVHVQPVMRWAHDWNVVGPFPSPQIPGTEYSPAVDSVYGPERDPDLGARYAGPGGAQLAWKAAAASEDGQVRLNPHFSPDDWVAAYAQAFLYAPDARDATLLLGADDAHVLWVNGERVSERVGRHISVADDIEVKVRLRAGWNRLLLKVADLDGGWAFQVRAADPTAQLRWSAQP
ncbi:MAG: DUF2961 domain-containing protein [Gemmatimonadales bacterium]|jgi:hypothetical protein